MIFLMIGEVGWTVTCPQTYLNENICLLIPLFVFIAVQTKIIHPNKVYNADEPIKLKESNPTPSTTLQMEVRTYAVNINMLTCP